MIELVLKINGNPIYMDTEVTLALVEDELYLKKVIWEDFGVIKTLFKIDHNLVKAVKKDHIGQSVLLDLIRPRKTEDGDKLSCINDDVKTAMKIYDLTGDDQTDIGGIKGLTITENGSFLTTYTESISWL